MRITEAARSAGATPDEIRYFERKGFIRSRWIRLKQRRVRDYPEAEVRKIELIVKYRRQGFEHNTAYEKALEEMARPRLI